MKAKAILEFEYPDDEDALLFALKGQAMYKALANIKMVTSSPYTKTEMVSQIKTVLNEIFVELGE